MTSGLSQESSKSALQWQELGAWHAGTVGAVALDSSSGALRGLLASRAGLYQWQQPNALLKPYSRGLSDLHVVAVAFAGGDSKSPAMPLAATATGRIFRQSGAGEEGWHEITSWAGLGVAVALAPSPAFAEDRTLFVGTPTGIFRTQDDGQSWESCNFGLLDEETLCLLCAPNYAQSEILWAGTAGGGLYRSRNSGRAWRESGFGLPDAAVQALAVSPNFDKDQTVYVGMEANGLYVSHDGGENWSPLAMNGYSVNSLASSNAEIIWAGTEDGLWRVDATSGDAVQVAGVGEVVMSVAASLEGRVAAGFFGSGLCFANNALEVVDSITWQRPLVALHAPPILKSSKGTLIALDADGLIACSSDGGANWVEMDSVHPDGVFAVAAIMDSTGRESIFATTSVGISRWLENEEGWVELESNLAPSNALTDIELSPSFERDQTLLLIEQESTLHLSQDGGSNWRDISGAWQGQSLMQAHFASNSSSDVVALTMQPTATGHFNFTLWQTHNVGAKWEVLAGLTSGVPAATIAWPADELEQTIYLATQHRVIKLYQKGEPPELQLHQHFFDESLSVTALAASPEYGENGTIWAATTGGLFVSMDRGVHWGLALDLPGELPVLWLDATAAHLKAVTIGGRTWHANL